MIVAPTKRAILLIVGAAPFALLIGVVMPAYWSAGLAWLVFITVLCLLDAYLSRPAGTVQIDVKVPATVSIGHAYDAQITATFPPGSRAGSARIAILVSATIDPGHTIRATLINGCATLTLTPQRRGLAQIEAIWLRWHGPLGLAAQQRCFGQVHQTIVVPDITAVRSEGVRLFERNALHGLIAQLERGEGSDFEALADFRAGMDKRAIDWRQSARHAHLLAKEYRTERDNNIVFAIDCGRAMSEPLDGVPRVDRALSAALLAAWAALKLGDRASLYGFDARPRLHSGALSGIQSFAKLQRLAAMLDYSSEETNHILALSSLSQQLKRRSLIILFTDFTDPTGAALLVQSLGWLMQRHVVLFVVMRDADLSAIMNAEPRSAADVTRAVAAAALVGEQRKVMARLRRLGLDVIEAEHHQIGLELINAYIAIKRKGRL